MDECGVFRMDDSDLERTLRGWNKQVTRARGECFSHFLIKFQANTLPDYCFVFVSRLGVADNETIDVLESVQFLFLVFCKKSSSKLEM